MLKESKCIFRGKKGLVGGGGGGVQAGVTKATADNLIGIDILVSEEI